MKRRKYITTQLATSQPALKDLIDIEITPAAKKLAKENKVDVNLIKGTGKDGKVIVKDVRDYIA